MAELAISQPFWVRWLAGAQPLQPSAMAGAQRLQPSSGAWLVIIDSSHPAAPATRTDGSALVAPAPRYPGGPGPNPHRCTISRRGRRSAPPPCRCGPSAYTVKPCCPPEVSDKRRFPEVSTFWRLARSPAKDTCGGASAPLTPEGARRLAAASHAASASAPLGAGPRREGASLAASASTPW